MTENQSAISHNSGMLSKWNISCSIVRDLCQEFSIAKHVLLEHQIPPNLPIIINDFLGHARNDGTFFWQTSKSRSDFSKPLTSSWLNRRSKETGCDQMLKTTSTRRKILKQSSGNSTSSSKTLEMDWNSSRRWPTYSPNTKQMLQETLGTEAPSWK